jgi:hypothetical protein
MDDRPHKAHRPAQSGAKAEKKNKGKGKEKQHGFNEKVLAATFFFFQFRQFTMSRRLLHRSQVVEQTVKADETLSETKRACMSPS